MLCLLESITNGILIYKCARKLTLISHCLPPPSPTKPTTSGHLGQMERSSDRRRTRSCPFCRVPRLSRVSWKQFMEMFSLLRPCMCWVFGARDSNIPNASERTKYRLTWEQTRTASCLTIDRSIDRASERSSNVCSSRLFPAVAHSWTDSWIRPLFLVSDSRLHFDYLY